MSLINWNKAKVLPRKEQIQLAIQAQAGDTAAREKLILSNAKLASKLAGRFSGAEFGDLESEAFLALCQAVDSFNPEKGTAFSTWAGQKIKDALLAFISVNTGPVNYRKTKPLSKAFWGLSRARWGLVKKGNYSPTPADIAEFLGVPVKAVKIAMEHTQASVNLDSRAKGEDTRCNHEVIGNGQDHGADLEHAQLVAMVRNLMDEFEATLTKHKQAKVWVERIRQGRKAKYVAADLGCTVQYISNIERDLKVRFVKLARAKLGVED